jgi:neutral ceramidase
MASALQAGAYRLNITPPLGICMEGSFGVIRARDVWDDLYTNALVIDDGHGEVALISVDVCSIPTFVYHDICRQVTAMTGIGAERVILTATHTHSGPVTGEDLDGIYEVSEDYVSQLKKKVASAVRLAQTRKQPVTVGVGRGENRDYVFNRRLSQPDGSIAMNWIDPRLIQEARSSGAVDSEVLVMRLDGAGGRPVAHVVNYANHNNAAPFDVISADYAGVMGDHLRAIYGPDLGVLFLPGAAGNVNWLDHHARGPRSPALYRKIGKSLAGTVLEIEARLAPLDSGEVWVGHEKMMLPERPYRDYDVAVDGTFGPPEGARDFFDAYRQAYERYKELPLASHEVDVHVVRLGDQVALCTNPAELFTEYGLEIKARSPFPYTMVTELTNGLIGYVPTREAFDQGGYEVRKIPGNSFMAVDTGERIVEAWTKLLHAE